MELEAGLDECRRKQGLNDRVYEIASLRERIRQMANGCSRAAKETILKVDGASRIAPSARWIFGNNINTQNLSAPYDSERGRV